MVTMTGGSAVLWQSVCVLVMSWIFSTVHGLVYYCSQTSDQTTSITINETGLINTNYAGENNYGNNRRCVWILDAGQGYRVQLTVKATNLQWAPDNAICSGYDHMEIHDGDQKTSRLIVDWCGNRNPEFIISTGRYVYVYFSTNEQNIYDYTGIQLEYQRFSFPGFCPVGWNEFTSNCYKHMTTQRDWKTSQHHCTYQQSNLVSLTTDQEEQFVNGLINSTSPRVWIGLHDIVTENQYEWVDQTQASVARRWSGSPHSSDPERDCVAIDSSSGVWTEGFCGLGKNKYGSICKMKKDAATTVFKIPEAGIESGRHDLTAAHWVLIAFGVTAILILCAVIGYCIYKKNSNPATSGQTSPCRSSSTAQTRVQPKTIPMSSAGQRDRQQNYVSAQPPTSASRPPDYQTSQQQHRTPTSVVTNTSGAVPSGGSNVHIHIPQIVVNANVDLREGDLPPAYSV